MEMKTDLCLFQETKFPCFLYLFHECFYLTTNTNVAEMEGEVGLVAGRSQREKRRSYKDLLREEEEIDAQVRKTSKKRRVSRQVHLFFFFGKTY